MPRVAPEDISTITHIKYVSESIHDFGDNLYEDLMERDHEEAKKKCSRANKSIG